MKKNVTSLSFTILFIVWSIVSISEMVYADKTSIIGDDELNIIFEIIINEHFNNPEAIRTDIKGPAKEYINVRPISLKNGARTYCVEGVRFPFYGDMHNSMLLIYEKTPTGYRQLADLGAGQSVTALKLKHNGYKDLEVVSIVRGRVNGGVYSFDGTRYREVTQPYSDLEIPALGPVKSNELQGFKIKILYTRNRQEAAIKVGARLQSYGAKVNARETAYNDSIRLHVRKLYYYFPSEKKQVMKMAKIICDIEKVTPEYDTDPTVMKQKKEVALWMIVVPATKSLSKE